MKSFLKKGGLISLTLILTIFISACGSSSNTPSEKKSVKIDTSVKGSRDNTPQILLPEAPGTVAETSKVATIDYSNVTEGYIMVTYFGSNEKVKLQITGPDSVTYTYNLHGDYEVFPLTAGDGNYKVAVYENVSGTQYSTAMSITIKANGISEFRPYLYPNQYVNFDQDSLPIAKAQELANPADTDLDVIENVYNYIIENFSYDYDKAATVQSGYLPDVDEIFKSNTGICFDYASVMACMLRTQRIPTRLEVGYKGEEYHAWISTYVEGKGWINGVIEFDGKDWKLLDPTFASTSKSPTSFTADEPGYITKFVY